VFCFYLNHSHFREKERFKRMRGGVAVGWERLQELPGDKGRLPRKKKVPCSASGAEARKGRDEGKS